MVTYVVFVVATGTILLAVSESTVRDVMQYVVIVAIKSLYPEITVLTTP